MGATGTVGTAGTIGHSQGRYKAHSATAVDAINTARHVARGAPIADMAL